MFMSISLLDIKNVHSEDEKILTPHDLFSKLKKKPAVVEGMLVDVNKTVIRSMDILNNYLKSVVFSRLQTKLTREPLLVILNSYPVHQVKENAAECETKHKIFFALIPGNLS